MTARLNITIPDDLQERLQSAKEIQPELNVSAICQKSIEAAIVLIEARQKAGSKRQQTIDRLNLQIRRGQREWYRKGRQDGIEAAPDLNYEDFQVVLELTRTAIDPLLLVSMQERSQKVSPSQPECPDPMRVAYHAGWIDGVLEFWNDIKNQLAFDTFNDEATAIV